MEKKKTVLILRGLPASGKSTYARKLVTDNPSEWKRVSKDDLRAMLDNGNHSKPREQFVCEARNALILTALTQGYSIVIDDTNLNPVHVQDIQNLVRDIPNITVKINDEFCAVSPEECIKRDQQRANYVGERVIRRMYNKYLRTTASVEAAKPAVIPFAPNAIICDLDGTLAHMNGRNPYDASTCEEDGLNRVVYEIVKIESAFGKVLLVSGRSEEHRTQTEAWLKRHYVPYDALWMRPAGDSRKDSIIKQEIYEREILGKYNVQFVLDDRNQVVALWRSLGLTCLQVADGDF